MSRVESKPFAEEGKVAVYGIRRAFADMLASVGADPSQPQEVARRFGLDKTLAWRISRVVGEDDAWEVVQHIPKQPSIKLFVNALLKHGADRTCADDIWKALEEFDDFVRTHSGDRETLEIMASGTGHKSALKKLETFRKMGFQANSAIWGVQTRMQFGVTFLSPSKDPGKIDLAVVSGMVGFRRLRPNVAWAISSQTAWDYERTADGSVKEDWSPLDPTIGPSEVPLIRQFCGKPAPAMRVIEERTNERRYVRRYMLSEGDIGNTAATTVVLGWVHRAAGLTHQSYPGEHGEHGITLSTPAEEVVRDLYIHKDLAFAFDVTASAYSQLPGGPQYPVSGKEAPQLPIPTDIIDLGSASKTTTAPGVPRYAEMVEFAAERLGNSLGDFHAFRFRLKYPPIPSMVVLRHSLLPMPLSCNGHGSGPASR